MHRTLASIVFFLIFVLMSSALFNSEEIVGVADNGDFWRITNEVGLQPEAQTGRYVLSPYYKKSSIVKDDYFSSTSIIAWMSKPLSFLFGLSESRYSIQQMGVTYIILLFILVGYFFVFYSPVIAIMLALPFLDSRYFIYFNSFFAFPLMFLVLYGVLALHLSSAKQAWRHGSMIGVWLLLLLGFFCAHQFMSIAACFLLVYFFQCLNQKTSLRKQLKSIILTTITVALAIVLRNNSNNFSRFNEFDAIFSGPTFVHENPQVPLENLGIDRSLWHLARTGFFSDEVYFNPDSSNLNKIEKSNLDSISKLSLARQYFLNGESTKKTLSAVKSAFLEYHSASHGNYAHAVDPPDRPFIPAWSLYRLRKYLSLHMSSTFFFGFLALNGLLLFWLVIKKRSHYSEMACFFYMFSISQLVTSLLGSGLFALGRHMLVAGFSYDLCLLLTAVSIAKACSTWEAYAKT